MAQYGLVNKGQADLGLARKLKQAISDAETAQRDIGGVENAAIGLNQAYGGLGKVFDQQQNAGITGMRQMAGQQFAAMAGRGGASNAMASAGAGAANAQMAGQMGTFMSDMAAQRAQAAIAGAQSQYQTAGQMYDLRVNAAAAGLDAAELEMKHNLSNMTADAFKQSLTEQAAEILRSNNPEAIVDWVNSFENANERKAAYEAGQKASDAVGVYFAMRVA